MRLRYSRSLESELVLKCNVSHACCSLRMLTLLIGNSYTTSSHGELSSHASHTRAVPLSCVSALWEALVWSILCCPTTRLHSRCQHPRHSKGMCVYVQLVRQCWSSTVRFQIGIDLALLSANSSLMAEAYERVHKELAFQPITKYDGMRPDGSFSQHAGLLYK